MSVYYGYRRRFYERIAQTVNRPNGYHLPAWVHGLHWILFPLWSIKCYVADHTDGYRPRANCWEIHGVRISNSFFQLLSEGHRYEVVKDNRGNLAFRQLKS
jgi:hypothetical protein